MWAAATDARDGRREKPRDECRPHSRFRASRSPMGSTGGADPVCLVLPRFVGQPERWGQRCDCESMRPAGLATEPVQPIVREGRARIARVPTADRGTGRVEMLPSNLESVDVRRSDPSAHQAKWRRRVASE